MAEGKASEEFNQLNPKSEQGKNKETITTIFIGPYAALMVPNPYLKKQIRETQWKYCWSYNIPGPDCSFWDKREIFVIEIPKTGSLSLQHSLPINQTFGHMYGLFYPQRIRHKLRAIVRNPYDRLVSAYLFMHRGGFNNNRNYLKIRDNYRDFEDWVLNGLQPWQTMYNQGEWESGGHGWREPIILQTEWLLGYDRKKFVLDQRHIGRFENYTSDVQRLCGIPAERLKKINVSKDRKPWPEYYQNPAVRDKVARLYAKDFELLGYSTEINSSVKTEGDLGTCQE